MHGVRNLWTRPYFKLDTDKWPKPERPGWVGLNWSNCEFIFTHTLVHHSCISACLRWWPSNQFHLILVRSTMVRSGTVENLENGNGNPTVVKWQIRGGAGPSLEFQQESRLSHAEKSTGQLVSGNWSNSSPAAPISWRTYKPSWCLFPWGNTNTKQM